VREPEKTILTLGGDRRRRPVGTEKIVDVEFIERDQPRDHARHLRVPAERAVLGSRQRQSSLNFGKTCRGDRGRGGGERENRKRRIHATSANQSR
jgi:hypothetical protein